MGSYGAEVDANRLRRSTALPTLAVVPRSGAKSSLPTQFEKVLTLLELAADFITVFGALHLAYNAGFFSPNPVVIYQPVQLLAATLSLSIIFVLMLDREDAYSRGNGLLRVKETERILRVSALLFLLLFLICYFARAPFPVAQFLVATVLVPSALIAEKQFVYVVVRALHLKGFGVCKVLIYGASHTGRRVFSALARSPKLGLDPVLMIDDDPATVGARVFELAYRRQRSVPIVSGPITSEFLVENGVGMVVVAIPSLARDKFIEVFNAAAAAGAELAFVPNHHVPFDSLIEHADIDGLLLASLRGPSQRIFYGFTKRVADLVLAFLLSVLFAPVCAIIAVLVKIDSKGPVIFVQKRVGKDLVLFDLYKFRTMYTDVPAYGYSPLASEDPRITRMGRFLRRTSLDEVPQLINVLRGEMSLVGPRPEMPFIVDTYTPRHRQRLQVKPGITGLWQLSADRALLIHENIEYDLYYIRNRNFFMDVAILLHTLFFFMRGI
ncbi:MAG: exopolysaccharide biosynthesis polyprenyl glycosylphosphotransferase [Acidobacteriia bacterium]|nr:exopolysaccharide biosynthesis polyprenyl glycosylphosphotransferase [Terriglobia bacterium]